jgi:hypothetical protein
LVGKPEGKRSLTYVEGTILKWILGKRMEWYGMDSFDQRRNQGRALVNMAMKFQIPYNVEEFLKSSDVINSYQ